MSNVAAVCVALCVVWFIAVAAALGIKMQENNLNALRTCVEASGQWLNGNCIMGRAP